MFPCFSAPDSNEHVVNRLVQTWMTSWWWSTVSRKHLRHTGHPWSRLSIQKSKGSDSVRLCQRYMKDQSDLWGAAWIQKTKSQKHCKEECQGLRVKELYSPSFYSNVSGLKSKYVYILTIKILLSQLFLQAQVLYQKPGIGRSLNPTIALHWHKQAAIVKPRLYPLGNSHRLNRGSTASHQHGGIAGSSEWQEQCP